jgi:hypothetical protein
MTKFYRLRDGKLTWSRAGEHDVRRQLRGWIGMPKLQEDNEDWRLVIPLNCEMFEARISILLQEPEFQTLAPALRNVELNQIVTLSGSGRLAVGGDAPSPAVEPKLLGISEQLQLAEETLNEMVKKVKLRLGFLA